MPTTSPKLGLLAPVGADFPSEYRLALANHAAVLDNALVAGAWVALTLAGGFSTASGFSTPRGRTEGDIARLDGELSTTAAVTAGALVATLPNALAPQAQKQLSSVYRPGASSATSPGSIVIVGTFLYYTGPASSTATFTLSLDGVTYPLF